MTTPPKKCKKSAKKGEKSAKKGSKNDPQNVQKLTFLHVALLCTKKHDFCKNRGGWGAPRLEAKMAILEGGEFDVFYKVDRW